MKNCPPRLASDEVIGRSRPWFCSSTAQKKSLNTHVNCSVPRAASAGLHSGMVTCQNWRSTPAPSIIAASLISAGSVFM